MIKKLFGPSFDVMEKALSLRTKRQAMIASNLANVDTPGYKAKDLDFRRLMKSYMERELGGQAPSSKTIPIPEDGAPAKAPRLDLKVTDRRHLLPPSQAAQADGVVVTGETGVPNNVDLDQEMAKLAENSIKYQATLQMLVKKFEGLKTAVTEGGRT